MPDRLAARVTYGHEYEQRLRIALVGCGGQAFRNLLPSLHYAPVELVATCDISGDRAAAYARHHAAARSYTDYETLLECEAADAIDAVLLATGYDANGRPLYPGQATRAMEAGLHVFMEKPPAASVGEIEAQRDAGSDQLALIEQELGDVRGLVEQGLARKPRQLALEREAARLRGLQGQ